jgi:carbon-monoxide dehydrogenase medium subunit
VRELFTGPGKSALDHASEVIVQFRFRGANLTQREATAFKRIMRPQGVALPILGLAAWVRLDGDTFEAVRLSVGPAGPVPLRPTTAEKWLEGRPATDETIASTVEQVWQDARLRTSPHRATADYRKEMVAVLVRRALALAVKRARTGEVIAEAAE